MTSLNTFIKLNNNVIINTFYLRKLQLSERNLDNTVVYSICYYLGEDSITFEDFETQELRSTRLSELEQLLLAI